MPFNTMIQRPSSTEFRTAERIVCTLQEAGHQALLAGGCVRDLLMGVEPKDYDVATTATPEQVARLFPYTKPVGTEFGVMLVIEDGTSFQVATFRSEGDYADGRHPDRVSFATAEDDAKRRDFTINGMYWDPACDEVMDTVGGRADIERGVVRAIGDPTERLREDHLRIVRAVRFAARLEFTIEERTRQALIECAPLVERIVPERMQQELRVILTDRNPALALRMMDELGMLTRIFPELEDARGCEQPENYHPEGDVFVHTLLTVEKAGAHPEFAVALAALLHDIGKPEAVRRSEPKRFPEHERIGAEMAEAVCSRLRLPRDETDRVCWLVKRHMYFKEAQRMKTSTLKRLFAEPGFEHLCALIKADALASWGVLDDYHYVLQRRQEMSEEEISPPPLISGRDLLAKGYKPGPALGKILAEVREQQLQGELTTREEALAAAERMASQMNAPRE